MKVLVTGTSQGIGRAIALTFLKRGHQVVGFDRQVSSIIHSHYQHYQLDIGDYKYPDIKDVEIIVNNAGSLEDSEAFKCKVMGAFMITETYAFQDKIKAVINISSNSAHYGIEMPLYCMANGALLSYTKGLARRLAQYGATANSVSPGYVDTTLDQHVRDAGLGDKIIKQCLLKHIQSPNEIAELVYYLGVVNKSITGQDILMDCGECLGSEFIETEENIKKFYRSQVK